MVADVTDRDFNTKMHYNFVIVNPNHVEFKAHKDQEPFMKFPTSHLNYKCNN